MKQAVGVFLILVALAATAVSASDQYLDTVQRDEQLRLECPLGWQLLYLDSDHANPTCIFLDLVDPVSYAAVAKQRCALLDSWLAEPEGWLHHEIYERIYAMGYNQESFWIGGTDSAAEGVWVWERTGKPMPMGTPHWEHCAPSQPLPNDRNSNDACIWPGGYYFFSCQNNSIIRTMCQKYPTAMADDTHQ